MPEFATSIDIEAPPDIVFDHLVTPEGMVAWLGQAAELDATPGGIFAVDIGSNSIRGEYLEVDPPHSVVITWGVLGSDTLPAGSSRVEFHLTPICHRHPPRPHPHRPPRPRATQARPRVGRVPRPTRRSRGRHRLTGRRVIGTLVAGLPGR